MPRRSRRRSRLELLFAAVLTGIIVGGSLWLDRHGEPVTAKVVGKSERITPAHDPRGTWYRRYQLGVEFRTAGGTPMTASVEVPRERFDTVRKGDPVEIRYVAELPILARTMDRSTTTVAWDAVEHLLAIPILLWIGVGIATLWIAARVGTWAIIAAGLAWAALAFPLIFPAVPTPRLGSAESTARVESVVLVTKSPERRHYRRRRVAGSESMRRLAVPYQVVQLGVPVSPSGDTVLAVDAVDSGSVPGLAPGASLRVLFDPAAPGEARLADGTRVFLDRNRFHFMVPVMGIVAVGMLGAWSFRARRRTTLLSRDP